MRPHASAVTRYGHDLDAGAGQARGQVAARARPHIDDQVTVACVRQVGLDGPYAVGDRDTGLHPALVDQLRIDLLLSRRTRFLFGNERVDLRERFGGDAAGLRIRRLAGRGADWGSE